MAREPWCPDDGPCRHTTVGQRELLAMLGELRGLLDDAPAVAGSPLTSRPISSAARRTRRGAA